MSAAPFGFGPPVGGSYSGLRRSVIDDVTGQPVITSAPTGEVVQRSTLLPVGRDDAGRLVPALPSIVTGAVEAAKFPGQVYRGEASVYDPTTGQVSDEAIGKAADIAGLAFTGSVPFSKPAGAIGMFGGRNAKTADLPALKLAETLDAKFGASQEQIWEDTGWFKGADQKWRFEIPDDLATLGPVERAPAGYSRLHHDDLAEAYPSLWRETQQSIREGSVAKGRYDAEDGMIHAQAPSEAMQRSVALHEYQHPIQRSEGFAVGDNPQNYGPGAWEAAGRPMLSDALDAASAHAAWARDQYHRSAGEVEARNVQRRADMSPEQRFSTPPWLTQDVPDAEQIVRFGIGGAAALGAAGALANPDAAEAATSQGTSPVSASPFGFGAPMAPEDLARLFGRMPIGAPQGFAPVAESEADVQRLERATGMVPQSTAPKPRAGLVDVAPATRSGAMTVPLPPARPAEFATSEADLPAAGAQPIMAAPAAPASTPAAPEGPSFGDRLMKGLKDNGDYLGALGAGLLSSPTWHGGVAAAMQLASKTEKDRAVTDLAKAEYGLKARKLAQETGALKGNAAILKRAYPSLTDEEAMAQGSNSAAVTEALKILRDPNHGRESDPNVIRARAQAQAEGTAAGGKDDVQLVTRPDGSIVAVNKSQIGETTGAPAVTPVVPGASKLASEADERRQLVVSQGKDPNDPRYADFIVSGTLPKETQQLLTASDKKAIMEGEDSILSHTNTITQLNRALKLSKKAYDGAGASQRALVTSNLPGFLGGGSEESLATRELDNVVTGQALDSLKSIFGGAPTEGERAILLQIQGSANLPQTLREQIYNNAIAKVQQKMAFEQERVNQLRGGTYYKQGNGAVPVPQAAPALEATAAPSGYSQPKSRADYDGLPSGAKYIAPDGSVRVKP